MKIDIEVVKNYLTVFQKYDSPVISSLEIFKQLGLNHQLNQDIKLVYHYLKILFDQDLIDIESIKPEDRQTLGFTFGHGGTIFLNVRNFRLTNDGHKTLEVMLQPKIWNFTKSQLRTIGVESLKQIPTLALAFIKTQLPIPL